MEKLVCSDARQVDAVQVLEQRELGQTEWKQIDTAGFLPYPARSQQIVFRLESVELLTRICASMSFDRGLEFSAKEPAYPQSSQLAPRQILERAGCS